MNELTKNRILQEGDEYLDPKTSQWEPIPEIDYGLQIAFTKYARVRRPGEKPFAVVPVLAESHSPPTKGRDDQARSSELRVPEDRKPHLTSIPSGAHIEISSEHPVRVDISSEHSVRVTITAADPNGAEVGKMPKPNDKVREFLRKAGSKGGKRSAKHPDRKRLNREAAIARWRKRSKHCSGDSVDRGADL